MKINGKNTDLLRSELAKTSRAAGADQPQGKGPAEPVQGPARPDSVQISDAGRARAAGLVDAASSAARAELTPERVAEIRQRILEGAYDSVHVVDQLARRMLASGDLTSTVE